MIQSGIVTWLLLCSLITTSCRGQTASVVSPDISSLTFHKIVDIELPGVLWDDNMAFLHADSNESTYYYLLMDAGLLVILDAGAREGTTVNLGLPDSIDGYAYNAEADRFLVYCDLIDDNVPSSVVIEYDLLGHKNWEIELEVVHGVSSYESGWACVSGKDKATSCKSPKIRA